MPLAGPLGEAEGDWSVDEPPWRPESLTLMSDYEVPVPLWIGPGVCLDRKHLDRLRLSESLSQRLLEWQQHFDDHFGYRFAWDGPSSSTAYAEEGFRLLRDLGEELPDARVTLDLWPVTGQAPAT
ncbi:hypothetical protein CLV35_1010 [Motilibacter peucedani]|uniref:Uncharacterized protein n=1 Tax=Motilibacter peucedani TaxID=598650 RepID=A0A420XUM4_9ACTN|nr:hypothetical protein CLV35_1010 [Motilibacter peucedani]